MRDDLILTSTARRLRQAGLVWRAQVGDWCALLDGVTRHDEGGLWLVIAADADVGWATVSDAVAMWPPARIATADALWLPSAGQLKAWLRAHGYRVTTIETMTDGSTPAGGPITTPRQGWAASLIGSAASASPQAASGSHRCEATRGATVLRAAGVTEAETVAEVVAQALLVEVSHM